MKVKFVDYALAYQNIKPEVDEAMQDCLQRGDLILRKDVEQFEESLARFLNVKYCIGVASGTDALILSLRALGISPKPSWPDEVITTAYTFRATVEAIKHAGAVPVVADMGEPWSKYRTERTKAIIPAHIAGEVMPWKSDDLPMIEDAAQSIGSKVTGLAATYSFYPAKILGCAGDGGAVATNDGAFAAQIKLLRNHCKDDWKEYGYNSRLDNIQAAVLNVKLKYLPGALARRKEIALKYDAELSSVVGVAKPREIYQDYLVETDTPQKLQSYLAEKGIETLLNTYPFPALNPKGRKALSYESRTLRIPCNTEITDEQVKHVINSIQSFFI